MKNFKKDCVKKLINLMKNNELTEISIEDGDSSITIKTDNYTPVVKEKIVEAEENIVTETECFQEEVSIENNENIVPIVSNMIGLFYSKPSPKEAPFVKVGDEIEEGDVVCIIETIKLMNKITSDVSGKIVEICIEDGKPVEYGQVIMYVEKN